MVKKLNKRKQREVDAMRPKGTDTMVSDKELFKELGNKIKKK